MSAKIILVKVGDTHTNANNLRNGKYPFWGMTKQYKNAIQGLKKGTILVFITNKEGKKGSRVIGMAEFVSCYDRRDEPLFNINTVTNEQQGWSGDGEWEIQIQFENFYETESGIKNIWIPEMIDIGRQQLLVGIDGYKIQLPESLVNELSNHYQNFKYYGVCKSYPSVQLS